MKRYLLSLLISLTGFFTAFGMSFSEAQEHAYYLTDKMAYELDLTPEQYDQVYQVNLEYLLNVRTSNPFNYYWDYRNTDLSYILFDWQWSLYRAADYFYRPIIRRNHAWYFPLWNRYHRTYYYYSRPTCYHSWHGGIWAHRTHHTPSPFVGHRPTAHHGGMAGHGGHLPNHGNNHGAAHPGGNNHGSHNNGGARPGHSGSHNGNNHGTARPGNNNGHNGGSARPGNGGNRGGNSGSRPSASGSRPSGSSHSGASRPSAGSSRPGGSRSSAGSSSRGSSHSSAGGRSFGGGRR